MLVNSVFWAIFVWPKQIEPGHFGICRKPRQKFLEMSSSHQMSRLGRKIFCKITKPFSSNYCKMPDDRVCHFGHVQIGLNYTDKTCQGLVKPIVFYLIIRVSSSFTVDISRKATIRIVFTILWEISWIPSITISASFPHVTKIHAILICAVTLSNKTIRIYHNGISWEDDQGTKQDQTKTYSHFVNLIL